MKKNKKIWLSSPHIGGKELEYIKDVFDSNWIAPVGPYISQFEIAVSSVNNNYSVAALSSGTAAIHLALILLGVKNNDVVICPSFTFSATVNPIVYLGASPVLIDSENETWNMCPELLEEAIKDQIRIGKKPKAIILVHIYGMPANLNKIMRIAKEYDVPVIEDAAEALGSKYNNRPLGTFGVLGVLSFNGNKIITTSGGGALISRNISLIKEAKYLSTQARDEAPYYEHSKIGYNYRMSNVCAAIGFGQLHYLEDRILKKREINAYYQKELSLISEITFLKESEFSFSNYWLTTILLKDSIIHKEKLRLQLENNNIECRPLWKPMHLQPVFKDCISYLNGVSENLFLRGLCLPSGTNMKQEDLIKIVSTIKKVYEV